MKLVAGFYAKGNYQGCLAIHFTHQFAEKGLVSEEFKYSSTINCNLIQM